MSFLQGITGTNFGNMDIQCIRALKKTSLDRMTGFTEIKKPAGELSDA